MGIRGLILKGIRVGDGGAGVRKISRSCLISSRIPNFFAKPNRNIRKDFFLNLVYVRCVWSSNGFFLM